MVGGAGAWGVRSPGRDHVGPRSKGWYGRRGAAVIAHPALRSQACSQALEGTLHYSVYLYVAAYVLVLSLHVTTTINNMPDMICTRFKKVIYACISSALALKSI